MKRRNDKELSCMEIMSAQVVKGFWKLQELELLRSSFDARMVNLSGNEYIFGDSDKINGGH